MPILDVLFDPILPVFAIMSLGFVMGRQGLSDIEQARGANRLMMTIFLPILLFGLIAGAPIRSFSPWPVLAYAAVQGVVFAAGFLLASRIFRRSAAEAVLLAFCAIFANNAFYVLPISLLLYGPGEVLPVTTVIILDATVTFGGSIIALQMIALGGASLPRVAFSILRTPILQSIVLGFAVNLSGFELTAGMKTFVDFNGAAAAPVGLFSLGVVLSKTAFRLDRVVVTMSALKLLAFPALIWAGLEVLAGDDPERGKFLLASAGPSGTMAFSLALMHDVRTDAIAQIIVWTSLLSLITLAVLA